MPRTYRERGKMKLRKLVSSLEHKIENLFQFGVFYHEKMEKEPGTAYLGILMSTLIFLMNTFIFVIKLTILYVKSPITGDFIKGDPLLVMWYSPAIPIIYAVCGLFFTISVWIIMTSDYPAWKKSQHK